MLTVLPIFLHLIRSALMPNFQIVSITVKIFIAQKKDFVSIENLSPNAILHRAIPFIEYMSLFMHSHIKDIIEVTIDFVSLLIFWVKKVTD
jgi:hypothetical protein